jgi:hypothetical protein
MKPNWKNIFVAVTLSLGASHAFAGTNVGWQDLKAACENPSRFHNQVAPQNIEISCQDTQSRYFPTKSGTVDLDVSRVMTSSVISDKYSVSPKTDSIAMANEVAACPQFRKVEETLTLSRSISCDEILAYVGTSTDFCMGLASELRAANPDSVQVTEKDEYVSLCKADQSGRGQRGQRGQR